MNDMAKYAIWSVGGVIIDYYNTREEAIKRAEACAVHSPGVEFYVVTLDTLVMVNLRPTITRIPTQATPR